MSTLQCDATDGHAGSPARCWESDAVEGTGSPARAFVFFGSFRGADCDEIPISRRADSHFSEFVKGLVRISAACNDEPT